MQGVVGGVVARGIVDAAGDRRGLVVRERPAGAADHVVLSFVSGDQVVVGVALQVVVLGVALDDVLAALAVRHVDAVVAVDRVAAGGAVRQRSEIRRRGDVALAHDPADDVERIRAVQIVEDPLAALERTLDHGVVAGERVATAVAEDRVAAVLAAVDAAGRILRLDAGHHAVDPPGAAATVVSAGIAVDDVAREGGPAAAIRAGRIGCVAGAVGVPLEQILVVAARDAVVAALAVDHVVCVAAEQLVVAARAVRERSRVEGGRDVHQRDHAIDRVVERVRLPEAGVVRAVAGVAVLRLADDPRVVAGDGVEVGLALDHVVGVDAAVGGGARRRRVGPSGAADQVVLAVAAEDRVGAGVAEREVVARAALDRVAATLAVQTVVGVLACDRVAVRRAGGRIGGRGVDVPDLDAADDHVGRVGEAERVAVVALAEARPGSRSPRPA